MKMVGYNLRDLTKFSKEEVGTIFVSPSEGQIGVLLSIDRFIIFESSIYAEGFKEALELLYEKFCKASPFKEKI